MLIVKKEQSIKKWKSIKREKRKCQGKLKREKTEYKTQCIKLNV